MSDKSKSEEITEEVESDPMKGVKEIKGADAPMEAKVDLDIKTHQDAADPDVEAGGTTKESGKTQAAMPAQSSTPSAPSNQNPPKKRSKLLVILLVLCFACLICCIATYALRDRLLQFITTSSTSQDTTLTTVTEEEISANQSDLETLFEQKKAEAQANAVNGVYTVSFTEQELLTSAFQNAEGFDPTAIGLKFETGRAKVQIDVGKVLESQGSNLDNNPNLQNLPFDPAMLNGIIVNAELATTADGTGIVIQNLTTGNPILDSLIPQGSLNGIGDQIDFNSILAENGNTTNIQSIEFLPGELKVTIQE